jgi:hypothetical protein
VVTAAASWGQSWHSWADSSGAAASVASASAEPARDGGGGSSHSETSAAAAGQWEGWGSAAPAAPAAQTAAEPLAKPPAEPPAEPFVEAVDWKALPDWKKGDAADLNADWEPLSATIAPVPVQTYGPRSAAQRGGDDGDCIGCGCIDDDLHVRYCWANAFSVLGLSDVCWLLIALDAHPLFRAAGTLPTDAMAGVPLDELESGWKAAAAAAAVRVVPRHTRPSDLLRRALYEPAAPDETGPGAQMRPVRWTRFRTAEAAFELVVIDPNADAPADDKSKSGAGADAKQSAAANASSEAAAMAGADRLRVRWRCSRLPSHAFGADQRTSTGSMRRADPPPTGEAAVQWGGRYTPFDTVHSSLDSTDRSQTAGECSRTVLLRHLLRVWSPRSQLVADNDHIDNYTDLDFCLGQK